MRTRTTPVRAVTLCTLLAGAAGLGGCAGPQQFDSPESAVATLAVALRADDQEQLKRILGPDSDKLLSSGDDVADANGRAEFLRLYDEKHRLYADDAETRTLELGATEWPMPIPVVKGQRGWYFDTAAGLDEMLSRRIGRNELYTIQVCLAVVDAQREYSAADLSGDGWREYATKFRSEPGKKDGLFWRAEPGEPESPLGELVAGATAEGYTAKEGPQPFHGYYYRILTSQGPDAPGGAMDYVTQGRMIGGFGVIAWPAEYGNSGLKSFIVSHHGVVYEQDLGDDTDRIARETKAFNPAKGWEKADTSQEP